MWTLLGVIAGAFLTGIGNLWNARVERKKLIAIALADLLEVRHHYVSIDTVINYFRNHGKVPIELLPQLRTVLAQVIPLHENVHERYESAISLLAGIEPLLAFEMRSKNIAPKFQELVRGLTTDAGGVPAEVEMIDAALSSAIIPILDEATIRLAANHSLKTKRKVKRIVSGPKIVPPEMESLINKVLSQVEQPETKDQ